MIYLVYVFTAFFPYAIYLVSPQTYADFWASIFSVCYNVTVEYYM